MFIDTPLKNLKKCENQECESKNSNIFFTNDKSCMHTFCEECVLKSFRRNLMCLKNYCFSSLNENEVKKFLSTHRITIPEKEKPKFEHHDEFNLVRIVKKLEKEVNNDGSNKCDNPNCKILNPNRFYKNEKICHHYLCEVCIFESIKKGYICLKNYCFSKLNEIKVNDFI